MKDHRATPLLEQVLANLAEARCEPKNDCPQLTMKEIIDKHSTKGSESWGKPVKFIRV